MKNKILEMYAKLSKDDRAAVDAMIQYLSERDAESVDRVEAQRLLTIQCGSESFVVEYSDGIENGDRLNEMLRWAKQFGDEAPDAIAETIETSIMLFEDETLKTRRVKKYPNITIKWSKLDM